jgi:hypothetical protein
MASLSNLQRRIRDERRKGECAPEEAVALGIADDAVLCPEVAQTLEALASSHPALHASLARLNSAQITAVLLDEPSTLVRAQVGSGKTTVLVHKVLYLHLARGVPLTEIAVLTFTNKAAREIRERLASMSMAMTNGSGRLARRASRACAATNRRCDSRGLWFPSRQRSSPSPLWTRRDYCRYRGHHRVRFRKAGRQMLLGPIVSVGGCVRDGIVIISPFCLKAKRPHDFLPAIALGQGEFPAPAALTS